ncbi:uncharacterized protein [Apostichopus japonicus]|uniref:uncharacterized protein isoform X1 n=1 Tax=Stichopus japonicus TaxID=307972 RepID=UPI003AB28A92
MDIERNTSCSTVSSFDEGMLFEDPGSNTSCSTVSDDEEMSPELTTIELVKGSSCRITREQLDQVIMTTVGRKPEVMVRRLLETVFSRKELLEGCAFGRQQKNAKTKSGLKSIPLNKEKLAAIRKFVLRRIRKSGKESISQSQFRRVVNCKCAELRAKHTTK